MLLFQKQTECPKKAKSTNTKGTKKARKIQKFCK